MKRENICIEHVVLIAVCRVSPTEAQGNQVKCTIN